MHCFNYFIRVHWFHRRWSKIALETSVKNVSLVLPSVGNWRHRIRLLSVHGVGSDGGTGFLDNVGQQALILRRLLLEQRLLNSKGVGLSLVFLSVHVFIAVRFL